MNVTCRGLQRARRQQLGGEFSLQQLLVGEFSAVLRWYPHLLELGQFCLLDVLQQCFLRKQLLALLVAIIEAVIARPPSRFFVFSDLVLHTYTYTYTYTHTHTQVRGATSEPSTRTEAKKPQQTNKQTTARGRKKEEKDQKFFSMFGSGLVQFSLRFRVSFNLRTLYTQNALVFFFLLHDLLSESLLGLGTENKRE